MLAQESWQGTDLEEYNVEVTVERSVVRTSVQSDGSLDTKLRLNSESESGACAGTIDEG